VRCWKVVKLFENAVKELSFCLYYLAHMYVYKADCLRLTKCMLLL